MKARALSIAFGVGLALQLAMVIIGHFVPVVKNSGFAIGGMAISLLAGFLYAKLTETGWGDSLVGGILAGGACALHHGPIRACRHARHAARAPGGARSHAAVFADGAVAGSARGAGIDHRDDPGFVRDGH